MLIHRSEALLILIYQLQIHTDYPNYHKLDFIKTSSLYRCTIKIFVSKGKWLFLVKDLYHQRFVIRRNLPTLEFNIQTATI